VQSDLELLESWRGGDAAAGEALVARHFDSVCRFFRSKLGDDVDDLIQRTFLGCVESRDRIEASSFRAYLFAIARNRLYDALRGKRKDEVLDFGVVSVADLQLSPSQYVARNQEADLIARALASIPIEFQVTLELAYWEELSSWEIADVLGVAEPTVRSRMVRGRNKLRAAIESLASSPGLAESTWDAVAALVSKRKG
jgi:RNA polymerase sigma-70 factor (ECF subfamily)